MTTKQAWFVGSPRAHSILTCNVPDKPQMITAQILEVGHKWGKWLVAIWDCPVCDTHLEFHTGSHLQEMVTNACKVLDALHSQRGVDAPCPRCGVMHHVRKPMVQTVAAMPPDPRNRHERRAQRKINGQRVTLK